MAPLRSTGRQSVNDTLTQLGRVEQYTTHCYLIVIIHICRQVFNSSDVLLQGSFPPSPRSFHSASGGRVRWGQLLSLSEHPLDSPVQLYRSSVLILCVLGGGCRVCTCCSWVLLCNGMDGSQDALQAQRPNLLKEYPTNASSSLYQDTQKRNIISISACE